MTSHEPSLGHTGSFKRRNKHFDSLRAICPPLPRLIRVKPQLEFKFNNLSNFSDVKNNPHLGAHLNRQGVSLRGRCLAFQIILWISIGKIVKVCVITYDNRLNVLKSLCLESCKI